MALVWQNGLLERIIQPASLQIIPKRSAQVSEAIPKMLAAELRAMIRADAAAFNRLHEDLHTAYAARDLSKSGYDKWLSSAKAFHAHMSSINPYLNACLEEGLADPALRRFAFLYLDEDTRYFRSGYIVERLMRKVKKIDLTEDEKATIRQMVLRRVEHGRQRDFRQVCRLIPRVQTDDFRREVEAHLNSHNEAIRRWAGFALTYFDNRAV